MLVAADATWQVRSVPALETLCAFGDAVWAMGAPFTLLCFSGGTITGIAVPFASADRLVVHPSGTLWAVGRDALWESVDGIRWARLPLAIPLAPPWSDLAFAPDGQFWMVATNDARMVHRNTDGSITIIPLPKDDPHDHAEHVLFVDRQSIVWYQNGPVGLWRRQHDTWERMPFAPDPATPGSYGMHIYAMVEDAQGYLWAGTDQGIARYDGTAWHSVLPVLHPPSGDLLLEMPLLRSGFSALAIDAAGVVWCGGANYHHLLAIDTTSQPYPVDDDAVTVGIDVPALQIIDAADWQ